MATDQCVMAESADGPKWLYNFIDVLFFCIHMISQF